MHSIADNEIHIWSIPLDNPALSVDQFLPFLSVDERKKATRYRLKKDQRCYTLTRGILRQLIARYVHCEPQNVVFEYTSHGKPILLGHSLTFNVSHSGNFSLIALAPSGMIGIDIEHIRPDFKFDRIQHRYFSAEQIAETASASDPRAVFFQLWTRKEAFIKAIGSGIFHDLNSFDVPLKNPRFKGPDHEKEWQVKTLDIHQNYAASIIFDLQTATIKHLAYPTDLAD